VKPVSNYSEEIMTDTNDSLTYYGGGVKAMGGGKIGGYLVLFTPADSPDLQGDHFTKATDFFIDDGDQRPVLYRHGMHPVIKSRKLGKARLTVDDVGVFIEGELEIRDKYEKAIYQLAEKGALGWSSGSMSHLVTRKKTGKSFEILSWPIGEASLTPNPVEGRTSAIPLKSLVEEDVDFDEVIKSFEQESSIDFVLAGIPAISRFCESVAPNSLKDGSQRSEAAADAGKEFITIANVFGEAIYSYASRLVRRSEHRFLKSGREIDTSTVTQVEGLLAEIERVQPAFENVKSALTGIRNLSQMSATEQKAINEKARLALWDYCRITGTTPEEIENG
jgi:phage head maturation protease